MINIAALSQEKSRALSDNDLNVVEDDSVRIFYKDGTPFSPLTFDKNYPRYPYYSFYDKLMLVKKIINPDT